MTPSVMLGLREVILNSMNAKLPRDSGEFVVIEVSLVRSAPKMVRSQAVELWGR